MPRIHTNLIEMDDPISNMITMNEKRNNIIIKCLLIMTLQAKNARVNALNSFKISIRSIQLLQLNTSKIDFKFPQESKQSHDQLPSEALLDRTAEAKGGVATLLVALQKQTDGP
ncbi:TPA: hypothetical protein L6B28_01795 [Pseudomonas aeruginosa]|uniref:hypothetical protein n=1 Tax=Pseudomonas aeruginosa TaxID=287 RepID=UPI003967086A|nr:hypothetical protein [Pseudomonas aeruginosa]